MTGYTARDMAPEMAERVVDAFRHTKPGYQRPSVLRKGIGRQKQDHPPITKHHLQDRKLPVVDLCCVLLVTATLALDAVTALLYNGN
jgi:hypothetical protein